MLDLYFFALENDVFPTEACLTGFTICDDTECGVEDQYLQEFEIDGYDLKIRTDTPREPLDLYVGVLNPN